MISSIHCGRSATAAVHHHHHHHRIMTLIFCTKNLAFSLVLYYLFFTSGRMMCQLTTRSFVLFLIYSPANQYGLLGSFDTMNGAKYNWKLVLADSGGQYRVLEDCPCTKPTDLVCTTFVSWFVIEELLVLVD